MVHSTLKKRKEENNIKNEIKIVFIFQEVPQCNMLFTFSYGETCIKCSMVKNWAQD